MKLRNLLAALALASAASLAHAEPMPTFRHIDVFYIPTADVDASLDGFGQGSDDGDGYGLRARAQLTQRLFVSGEYQTVEYDDTGIEIDQFRLGFGLGGNVHDDLAIYGLLEYARASIDIPGLSSENDNGIGLHAGLAIRPASWLVLNGQVGYITISDASGVEFLAGIRVFPIQRLSVFVEYRSTALSDRGADLDLDDLRAGLGFLF